MRVLLKSFLVLSLVGGVVYSVDNIANNMLQNYQRYSNEAQRVGERNNINTITNHQNNVNELKNKAEDSSRRNNIGNITKETPRPQHDNMVDINIYNKGKEQYKKAEEGGFINKSTATYGENTLKGELNNCRGPHATIPFKADCCNREEIVWSDCKIEEINTSMKKQRNLCELVSVECAEKVAGVCVRRRYWYCCFPSQIDRYARVDGGRQVGNYLNKGNCELGLTDREFEIIDFTQTRIKNLFNIEKPYIRDKKIYEHMKQ